jgi:hypothetical protein
VLGASYSLEAPRELLTVTSGYDPSCIFYTDGSWVEGCAGLAVLQMSMSGFGYEIQGLASVFTAKLCALFTALRHIVEVILLPERCLILTERVRSRLCCLGKLHIRLTLWCMNVNNCAAACARTELR